MVAEGLIVASEVTGFISFCLTALTWLGVYISLFTAARSAPKTLPLILGNLRQEILSERSLMRYRIKQGDQYHVWPGRQYRRVGNQQSHAKLASDTLRVMWKEFREIERMFTIGDVGDAEDGSYPSKKHSDDGSQEDYSDNHGYANGWVDGKGRSTTAYRGRDRTSRRLARRNSTIKSRMGVTEAGLSIDRRTYYNTDMYHRFLWWYKTSDIQSLSDRIEKMQIRRMERDLFETDELVKRGLQILGGLSGDDIWYPGAKGRGPNKGGGGGGGGGGGMTSGSETASVHRRRKRSSYAASSSRPGSRNVRVRNRPPSSVDGDAVREVYEKEVVRVRDQSSSGESPRSRGKSVTSTAPRRERTSKGRVPSTAMGYEIVSPGRVYIATTDDGRGAGGRGSVYDDRNWEHRPRSYSRERDRSQGR